MGAAARSYIIGKGQRPITFTRAFHSARRTVCNRMAGNGSVIFPTQIFQIIHARLGGIVGKAALDLHAPFVAFGHNIVGLNGGNRHRAAHARFHAPRHGGAFFHGNAAEQGGIDIISIGRAVVVHPHIHGLFRAVDGNGDAAFAGNAAYAGCDRAARVAGIHVVHAVQAFEDVARRIGLVAFEILLAQIGVGHVFAELLRLAFFIGFQPPAAHGDGIERVAFGRFLRGGGFIRRPQFGCAEKQAETGGQDFGFAVVHFCSLVLLGFGLCGRISERFVFWDS